MKLQIPQKGRYDKLHQIPEIDEVLDIAKKKFQKKYNIDYFCQHILHNTYTSVISRYDHDAWHEYIGKLDIGPADSDGIVAKTIDLMKPNETCFYYFDSCMKNRWIDARAEIIGERKYNGITIFLTDNDNNMIIYDLTMKDDVSFAKLHANVFNELLKDLISYKHLLLPFINQIHEQGSLDDRHLMRKNINTFKKENSLLFDF